MNNIAKLKETIQKELKRLDGSVAVYIKFLNTNKTILINEKKQFWAASVIKIPILCEFFRQVEEGKINPQKRVKVVVENRVEGSGVVQILDSEDEFTYLDLATLMIAVSDNAATNEIVDLIGWESVEKYMKELSLSDTTFKHKMMIKAGRGPNFTTACNIGLLLEKLYKNQIIGSEKIIDILRKQQDRTRIPLLIPNNIAIAHKPGSLEKAMHDVGIVYSENPFIFVFLSDDQKDKRLTNEVLSNCAKYCFDYSVSLCLKL